MSFNLGRANFILDANNEPILEKTAETVKQVSTAAKNLTKALAEQNNIRIKDVEKAADILIAQEKALASII